MSAAARTVRGVRYVPIVEDDGTPTGATFAVERIDGVTTIRYDSRGTTEGTRAYRRGLLLMLRRLSGARVTIADACIETRTTAHLDRGARQLQLAGRPLFPLFFDGKGRPMTVQAHTDEQADALRAAMHTAAARVGRAPDAKGGGNGTKRLRLYLRTRVRPTVLEGTIAMG